MANNEIGMVDHATVLNILRRHGWEPDEPTATWPHLNHKVDRASSFYHKFGRQSFYSRQDIYDWLGY